MGESATAAKKAFCSFFSKKKRWPFFLLCLPLAPLPAVTVAPLANVAGHPVLAARINGKVANLVLDTGSSGTALDLDAAARLGVDLHRMRSEDFGIGGSSHAYRGLAERFELGGLVASGQSVGGVVLPEGLRAAGLAGVFGADMLGPYDVDLDLAGGHLILFDHKDCGKPEVAIRPPLYSALLQPGGLTTVPVVRIVVGGLMLRALVDSGAPGTIMYRTAAARLGIDLAGLRAPGHPTIGGFGPRRVASLTHVLQEVRIGDLVLRDVPVDIIDQASPSSGARFVSLLLDNRFASAAPAEILLGADFLRRVHVWISHSSQLLVMQYPARASVLPK